MRCYFENIKHILRPVQAALVSRDFCLQYFALTLLEIYTTFRIYVADVFPYLKALAFVPEKSGKCKSSSPSTIPVRNRRKTISTEEKLEVISRLEKGERIVDICRNVRIGHSSARDILMLIELKEMLSQKLKCLYSKTTTVLLE